MNIYFSDFFGISHKTVVDYGAFDISLLADAPVFIDPFRLYASDKPEYRALHERIVKYLRYLRDFVADNKALHQGLINDLFAFPEEPNTFVGFCKNGNRGRGLGTGFAKTLKDNLANILNSVGNEQISQSVHLEKLCVICKGVGVDCISDFTTNLIKDFLLEYTEAFAKKYLSQDQCDEFGVKRAYFDFDNKCWKHKNYYLPKWKEKYIILLPRDMLTKDDTWINRDDLIKDLLRLPQVDSAGIVKGKFIELLRKVLDEIKDFTVKEKQQHILALCERHPEAIDVYINSKENRKEESRLIADSKINAEEIQDFDVINRLQERIDQENFAAQPLLSLDEVLMRARFFKHEIENNDVYTLFSSNGSARISEKTIQTAFRLVWINSRFDLNREPNNGRGPADFVVSLGADDKCVVEFKLASNKKLKQNLANQLDIYKAANKTEHGVCIIVYMSSAELTRLDEILRQLQLDNNPNIIKIDASPRKISASKVKSSSKICNENV